jgi:penicillin-binding protein 1C
MDLIYPREGVSLYIPVGLSGKSRVVFEAVHSEEEAVIYWHLDGNYLSATRGIHQMELLPEKGWHTLVLIDGNGEELIRNFKVIEKENE